MIRLKILLSLVVLVLPLGTEDVPPAASEASDGNTCKTFEFSTKDFQESDLAEVEAFLLEQLKKYGSDITITTGIEAQGFNSHVTKATTKLPGNDVISTTTEHVSTHLHATSKTSKSRKDEETASDVTQLFSTSGNQLVSCEDVSFGDAKIRNETGGVFELHVNGINMEVYCDLVTDERGLLVFQRRMDGSVDFYRNWTDYVNGFGNTAGEFWLGLETLHQFTSTGKYELRIDLEDWEGNKRYATYSKFHVGNAASTYMLTVDGYAGNAGDSLARQNSMKFSTKEKDSDTSSENCAVLFKGAWWYEECHDSNLNGLYFSGGNHTSFANGIEWRSWKGYHYSMKFAEMKIRLL